MWIDVIGFLFGFCLGFFGLLALWTITNWAIQWFRR